MAESWEILPEPDTLIFHIRQGVHWALDPDSEASRLVGGREMTAEDVAHSTVRNWTIGYRKKGSPYLSDLENPANSIYVSPTDKWALVAKSQPGMIGNIVQFIHGGKNGIIAPEVTEKYGAITGWKNVVGTGPFTLKDYVQGSALTYEKNPN